MSSAAVAASKTVDWPRIRFWASIALATIGLALATYLTIVHYVGFSLLPCPTGKTKSTCQTVQTSQWSSVAGIPVALLGLVGYAVMLATLAFKGALYRAATLGTALIGFAFSGYLTYRELFSIHAICEWCVGSAVIMTVLTILAIWRVVALDE